MKKIKNKNKNKNYLILLITLLISFIIYILTIWFATNFPEMLIEQLLFTMLACKKGANLELFPVFFKYFSVGFLKILPFIIIIIIIGKKLKREVRLRIIFFNKEFVVKVLPIDINSKFYRNCSIIILILTVFWSVNKFGIRSYISNQLDTSTLYDNYYINPRDVKIKFPKKKKNLIYLVLESMETSYSQYKEKETINNLIPNLSLIAENNLYFSNNNRLGGALEVNLTNWTVASLVAQTAGVPLNIPIDGNSYGKHGTFLPSIITLGEILEEEGYNQIFMMGSDSMFGERKNYFEQHGNYLLWDYNTAIDNQKIDKNYFEFWGFEDKKLFQFAQEEIIKLASLSKPFNFALLTVDTHFYDGYLDNKCETPFNTQYANAIYCSDNKVGQFIKWIQKQDFYEETTIIIVGDHLTMDHNFANNLVDSNRYIYNAFINSEVTSNNTQNRAFSVLDMFPTTLASLGVKIEGNRLGLGVNLFSSEKTLIEKIGYNKLNEEILKRSNYYVNNFIRNK